MSGTFALLYQPPCGQWYVHSHKLYPTPEAADAAAVKFLHPDTPRVVIPITFPGTPSQRLDAATVEREGEDHPDWQKHEGLGSMVACELGFTAGGADYWRTRAEVVRAIRRALATDPHQQENGNG